MTNPGEANKPSTAAVNSQQLVMRRDCSDMLVKVGWAVDMPLGRFEHLELITECDHCQVIHADNPLYEIYQTACLRARQMNLEVILQQQQQLSHAGWKLIENGELTQLAGLNSTGGDEFGSLRSCAMQMLFQLSANHPFVWCVLHDNKITHVQSKRPPKSMEELEAQVWKHHLLSQLQQMPGELISGRLVVKESGLWFCSDDVEDNV